MNYVKYFLLFFLSIPYSLFASDSFKDPLAAVLTAGERPDPEAALDCFLEQIDLLADPTTSPDKKEAIKAELNALPDKLALIRDAFLDLKSDDEQLMLIANCGADENERDWEFWNNRKALSNQPRQKDEKTLFFANRKFIDSEIYADDMAEVLFVKCTFTNCTFKGDFNAFFIFGGSVNNSRFENLTLQGSTIKNCYIYECKFYEFNGDGLNFIDSNFESCKLSNSNFKTFCFSDSKMSKIEFFHPRFERVEFNNTNLEEVAFIGLTGPVTFISLISNKVSFVESVLSRFDVSNVDIRSLKFIDSIVSKIVFNRYCESPSKIAIVELDNSTLISLQNAKFIAYVNEEKFVYKLSAWLKNSTLGQNFGKAINMVEGEPLTGFKRNRDFFSEDIPEKR